MSCVVCATPLPASRRHGIHADAHAQGWAVRQRDVRRGLDRTGSIGGRWPDRVRPRSDVRSSLSGDSPARRRRHGRRLPGLGPELGVARRAQGDSPRHAIPTAGQELERRFKRELVLARQVTHPNVIRIHDLGEIDGIKYITMPFVAGHRPGALLEQGKLPVAARARAGAARSCPGFAPRTRPASSTATSSPRTS